jgi:hypothetical protein
MPRLLAAALAAAVSLLAVPALAGAAVGLPRTAGDHYDRNATVVDAGGTTYLYFARSQNPCNRLAGCNADNEQYDLYVKTSPDGGKTYGPATFVAANPDGGGNHRGRTPAATALPDGHVLIFWADGGSQSQLYVVEKAAGSDTYSAPQPVGSAGDPTTDVFNVEAVTRAGAVLLYTEETGPDGYGVYARSYDATTNTASEASLVELNRNLPKAIVDHSGVVRLTYVDASAYPQVDVYVESSADGLTWPQPGDPAVTQAGSNWDPNLVQKPNGQYELHFAPDREEGAGRQQVGRTLSTDFAQWSAPVDLTPGFQGGVEYWDYWPEGHLRGNQVVLYSTSERESSAPAGTGHIWSTPGFGGVNGKDAA